MLTAVVGINWGDEGKGRMVDLLSSEYDIIVRYQGGNNAGHTVVNQLGKFVLNLLPSGILRPEAVNVMGVGMVIDIEHLANEMDRLRAQGITITPDNLKISNRAVICLPYCKLLDCLEEDRLADKKFGSTRRGIAPIYSDKYMKKGIRIGDLLESDEYLRSKLKDIVEWKNLFVENGYHADPIDPEEMFQWLREYGNPILPYITDTTEYLNKAIEEKKSVMFEAQLGALRDIDYGIYPFTSSSSVISAYAPIGAGIPNHQIDETLGIMKAYSSCVGEGPFTCEMFGEEASVLREAGGEYGAATGRPRRVGGFDVVASRYGVKVQGATSIALTKMDVLSCYDRIPVCTAYELDGKIIHDCPIGSALDRCKPVYEYLDGFGDINGITDYKDLPENAKKYIDFIEKSIGVPIQYISTGAERDSYIRMF